jgi:peptidoglycan DL-endopeptidase CwlO
VDFVAWRLNRDAGFVSAPYAYDWSFLTPTGGNAYQWRYAWRNHGWATSNSPSAGWVAWFSSGHVAYVKKVNGDGTVLLEEYNWQNDHLYSQRTIQPNEAQLYLAPPPR